MGNRIRAVGILRNVIFIARAVIVQLVKSIASVPIWKGSALGGVGVGVGAGSTGVGEARHSVNTIAHHRQTRIRQCLQSCRFHIQDEQHSSKKIVVEEKAMDVPTIRGELTIILHRL